MLNRLNRKGECSSFKTEEGKNKWKKNEFGSNSNKKRDKDSWTRKKLVNNWNQKESSRNYKKIGSYNKCFK